MGERTEIPNSVIGTIAEVIGGYYYNHSMLNALFMRSGAPGDPPPGNCVEKCRAWLVNCNRDPENNPIEVLGNVIQDYMDSDIVWINGDVHPGKEKIRKVLAKNGLSYQLNGIILKSGVGLPSKHLTDILRTGDFASIDVEFQRSLATAEADPPAGITAACSLIESLLKTYIQDQGLALPQKQNIRELWKLVRDDLELNPGSVEDDDLKRILSGLMSIVDGIGSLRTHVGSAHGRGPTLPAIGASEARLAINTAYTFTVFIMEVWDSNK